MGITCGFQPGTGAEATVAEGAPGPFSAGAHFTTAAAAATLAGRVVESCEGPSIAGPCSVRGV